VPSDEWENMYLAAGGAAHILLVGFKSEKLKPLTGKTLAEIAKMRGKGPIDTAMDLIAEDESRIGTIYFMISEENIKKRARQAMDFIRLRRSVTGARRRFLEIESAPARLRKFRTRARQICA